MDGSVFSKYVTKPTPHKLIYRLTGGLIGSRLPGVAPRVLLLTQSVRSANPALHR